MNNITKTTKMFVAGHKGMVGSAIVRELTRSGYGNLLTASREELDLFDTTAVNEFFSKNKPEVVILAAARVGGIKANMTMPADFLYENLLIQNNVIWAAHKHDVSKLIFLGSSCIYPVGSPQPMKEEYFLTGKLEPTNEGYAIAKISGMKLCEKIHEQYGKNFTSCMPTNIYGENDNFDPESSHVIPALIRRMHEAKVNNTKDVVIWGTGNSRREFLYVDDLAKAILWLLEKYDEKDFLNIGKGEDVSIKELAELVRQVVGYKGKLVFDSTKPDGMPKKLLDSSKMFATGWKPEVDLREGLEKSYDFYLEHCIS